ncbi:MAG: hypothetical protein N838_34325, partial [Thiohalocapsa sp. PB-PSB1]
MLEKTTLIAVAIGAIFASSVLQAETIDTRIGKLQFTHDFANGYPTDATVEKLFNEMDFQRAVQVYLWAIPFASMAQWQYAHREQLGAENGQAVFLESYKDRLGGLTYNATTPYVLPFIDLAEGPWVVVMPEAEVRGAAHDMWQIAITRMTEPGKYLFVGPGQGVPKDAEAQGYRVAKSPSMNLLVGIRLMATDEAQRLADLEAIQVYPYAERDNPKPRGYIRPKGKPWMAAAPKGLAYFERLAEWLE